MQSHFIIDKLENTYYSIDIISEDSNVKFKKSLAIQPFVSMLCNYIKEEKKA